MKTVLPKQAKNTPFESGLASCALIDPVAGLETGFRFYENVL